MPSWRCNVMPRRRSAGPRTSSACGVLASAARRSPPSDRCPSSLWNRRRSRELGRTCTCRAGLSRRSARRHASEAPRSLVSTVVHFNVPARLKFMRGTRSEWRAVSDSVTAVALARRDAHITLSHDGRSALALPVAASLRERVGGVWGAPYAESLVDVHDGTGAAQVTGLVERPADVGTRTRRVHLSVNGRAIRDRWASYGPQKPPIAPQCPPGSDRPLFLEVTIPVDAVDVNVHPAKAEVRFRDRWPSSVPWKVPCGTRSGRSRARRPSPRESGSGPAPSVPPAPPPPSPPPTTRDSPGDRPRLEWCHRRVGLRGGVASIGRAVDHRRQLVRTEPGTSRGVAERDLRWRRRRGQRCVAGNHDPAAATTATHVPDVRDRCRARVHRPALGARADFVRAVYGRVSHGPPAVAAIALRLHDASQRCGRRGLRRAPRSLRAPGLHRGGSVWRPHDRCARRARSTSALRCRALPTRHPRCPHGRSPAERECSARAS